MKILITEKDTLCKKGDVSFEDFSRIGDVLIFDNISREELLEQIPDVEAVLCNKVKIDSQVIERGKKLKYIGTFATGYDNVDVGLATKKGITVCNAAGYSTNAVTQQVIGYILHYYTKIAEYDRFVKADGWKNSPIFSPLEFSADEVYGKTLGIVGFGSIGTSVARAALGLGMNVKVYTRTPKQFEGVEFVGFNELLSDSDIISLHCPLNESTRNLINADTIAKMKDGAFLINTSRGGVVDENALYDALKSGKLSVAAIDVLPVEPMSADCRLTELPNIIITPHSAWSSFTTRKRLVKIAFDNLKCFIDGNPQSVVNR